MADEKLTFVHLSDIHFILGFSNESPFDIDKPVRDAILHDAKTLQPKLGAVSGVLLTGDIAYAGKAGEYKTALDWLAELTDILNCEKEYLWCVPGNHDVDRSVLKENLAISAVHDRLRTTVDREAQLRQHLELVDTGRLLFSPLKAYSEEFATRLGMRIKTAEFGELLRFRTLKRKTRTSPEINTESWITCRETATPPAQSNTGLAPKPCRRLTIPIRAMTRLITRK